MKKLAMLLLPLSLISTSALADTKNFEGLSAGLNLNLISAGVKLAAEGNSFDGLGGKQTQTAGVDVGYGYVPFGTNTVFTVGLDADLSAATIAEGNLDGAFSIKQKNRFGVYFAPGIALSKDALIYGKLGYNQMKGELSSAGGGGGSKTFRGVSYGAGTKLMISGNTFLKLEVGRYTFGSEKLGTGAGVDMKPSATVGTIGIGMRF